MTVSAESTAQTAEDEGKLKQIGLAKYPETVQWMFRPRFNLRSQIIETELGDMGDEDFEAINVTVAEKYGYKMSKGNLQSTIRLLSKNSAYDPVLNYLEGLPQGQEKMLTNEEWNSIASLAMNTEGEFEGKAIQKFLLAAVNRVIEPGCQVDFALVLKGKQGVGKSSFFRILAGEWFTDSMGNAADKKDDLLIMHKSWICEWSELDKVFQGRDRAETVKSFITSVEDVFRVPYGRKTSAYKRRSVLVGTTNRDDWAKDPTGNRRFPVVETDRVNKDWIRVNRDRIWARALHEARKGTPHYYTYEEEKEISRRADAYGGDKPELPYALELLRSEAGRWFNTKEICCLALEKDPDNIPPEKLRHYTPLFEALTRQGCLSARRNHEPLNRKHGLRSKQRVFCFPLNEADEALNK